ncbi:MAG TPA: TIGR00730 family Rossman fold protein [Chitinophagaceae bacterium]
MSIQSLAVFCGSQNGHDPLYVQQASVLGQLMAKNNVTLIYGGGSVGLMGAIANAVMEGGGKVVGVIPQVLVDWERQHKTITQLIVTEDMHVRKKTIYSMCDAALILPGGFGTLDELFEMLTWNQLSIHNKQIFILNPNGFYDHLIRHLHHMQKEKFLYDKIEERITVLNDVTEFVFHL